MESVNKVTYFPNLPFIIPCQNIDSCTEKEPEIQAVWNLFATEFQSLSDKYKFLRCQTFKKRFPNYEVRLESRLYKDIYEISFACELANEPLKVGRLALKTYFRIPNENKYELKNYISYSDILDAFKNNDLFK